MASRWRTAWAPVRTWRPTLHALAGVPLALGAGAVLAGILLVWGAAIASLLGGPGGWVNGGAYAVVAVAGPVALLWCARGFAVLQRARFRTVLGVPIAAPDRLSGGWPWRPVRPLRDAATWRELGYHAVALASGVAGGVLVAVCWLAPAVAVAAWPAGGAVWPGIGWLAVGLVAFGAAPWVALGVAHLDTAAARELLGPSRAEELAHRVESLARSRAEIVAATDAERRRIERDLHDGAQQRLVSLAMNLGMARANLTDASGPALEAIEAAHDEATQALAELREFVRGLHPAVLNDRGLDAALSGIAARAPLPVRLRVDLADRCAPTVEAVAYFVVSEALTNTAKHAGASHAEVTVCRVDDRLRVVVADDGHGGASAGAGTGLRGLEQRVAAVDGTLTVDSPRGGPTTITVELPCAS